MPTYAVSYVQNSRLNSLVYKCNNAKTTGIYFDKLVFGVRYAVSVICRYKVYTI